MFRNQEEIHKEFGYWKANLADAKELLEQLKKIENDEKKMTDAFYKNLEFGTGGLRGIMGVGTNRMNVFTVARASRGLAAYIKKKYPKKEPSVAISYDSRFHSEEFSQKAAEIFASNGIRVHIYPTLMPTPMLSWAVRELKCSSGIMITASHNPAEYNGYKVYGSDGCQITTKAAEDILEQIKSSNFFCESEELTFDMGFRSGMITFIKDDIIDGFMKEVKKLSLAKKELVDSELSIVYTPLNGTGLKPVVRTLQDNGFKNVFVVPEQKMPDGSFSTCPKPNPEEPEAMELGIKYAKKRSADIVLATDPDCDRVGVSVADGNDVFISLSGNEIGILLLDYVCRQRINNKTMPEKPIFMKSIVTTDLAERIAQTYEVDTINLLTGFKYIGEQIGILERAGCKDHFIFGFEESYGYLSGDYVRDKDGVGATFLICEMAAYYKKMGKTLLNVLEEIYKEHGYCLNTLYTYKFEGLEGFEKMKNIMKNLRAFGNDDKNGGELKSNILFIEDYYLQCRHERNITSKLTDEIPKTNMIKFKFKEGSSIIIRPSGTEPKLKVYLAVQALNYTEAKSIEKVFVSLVEKICCN